MLKKIEDEDERREVIAYINGKYGTPKNTKKNKKGDESLESQFMDAADSFGKNIFYLFLELALVAIFVCAVGHYLGYINIFQEG